MKLSWQLSGVALSIGAVMFGYQASALAAPMTVTNVRNYITTIGPNNVNIGQGVYQLLQANVVPNGNAGTTGTALGPNGETPTVRFAGSTSSPNLFQTFNLFNGSTGAYTLTFNNGPDQTVVTTPDLVGAVPIGLATGAAITGGGSQPTFSWSAPDGSIPDAVTLIIYDRTQLRADGFYNSIYVSPQLGSSVTSFQLPDTALLQADALYSLDIRYLDLRASGSPLSVSDAFFDFTLLPSNAPDAPVYLPQVLSDVYYFDIDSLPQAQTFFIDPLVATGYEYRIGAGNPNFASVTLPTGIASAYTIVLPDGSRVSVQAGSEYLFGSGGVDHFSVVDIPVSAGLDPTNPLAFITGLSLVADGRFSGTMTPLTTNVPEPSLPALLLFGFLLLPGAAARVRLATGRSARGSSPRRS